ncbi:Proton-dependent oligopeptide transporter family, partial [Dillenia turbinata]
MKTIKEEMEKGNNVKRKQGGFITMPPIFANDVCEKLAVGMTSLTTSAALPKLRPPPCTHPNQVCQEANGGQLAILYGSLLLTALGSGGIRPCVVAFGADQFDETDPKQKARTWRFFNWYYFCMGASMLVAVTVIVYIQDNVGWGWGLGIPTMAMFLSIIAFVVGYPFYRHLDPAGSPFTRLLQVSVAAFRKRKLQMAAMVTEEDQAHIQITSKPNFWRLNTVHRVEELKCIIRMGPIWATGILLITAYVQQSTFSLQQANTMNRHITASFQIPAASMSVFTLLSMLTTIVFYDRILVPIARKFTGLDCGINFLHRMGIGFVISILATFVAGFVEVKRKQVASAYGLINKPHAMIPISFFWLVPQYSLHGIAEAFMSIGHLEFFYDQAPESMRSTATALFWTSISAGNYVSTLVVTLVHKFSSGSDGSNWLPDNNLNVGRLEYFYWLITILQAVNLIYYVICAKFYTFKPIQVQIMNGANGKAKEENGVELVGK